MVSQQHADFGGYRGCVSGAGVIQANFHRRCDLRAQIQKFWNICSNLNFKEDSFYPFPSLVKKNNLLNGAFQSE